MSQGSVPGVPGQMVGSPHQLATTWNLDPQATIPVSPQLALYPVPEFCRSASPNLSNLPPTPGPKLPPNVVLHGWWELARVVHQPSTPGGIMPLALGLRRVLEMQWGKFRLGLRRVLEAFSKCSGGNSDWSCFLNSGLCMREKLFM